MATRLLLYEENTAFNHSLWNRFEMLQLLGFSTELLNAHNRQQRDYGYSPTQDAYYALAGEFPNIMSKAGKLWADVLQSDQFAEAASLFENADNMHVKSNLVYWLSLVYEYFIKPDGPPPPPMPKGAGSKQGLFGKKPPPPKEKDPTAPPDGGEPLEYDLDSDGTTTADMLTGGQGQTETPGDLESSDQAGVGDGFTLEIPKGFKMPSLDEVKARNETDEIMASFAGTEEGTPRDKRRFVEEFHRAHGTRNFAKFLGFAETVVGAATREVKGAYGHRKGYELGRWDGKVTAQEKTKVANGDLLALSRFADGKLRKAITQSNLPRGNGNVYLLRDESSSMRDDNTRDMAAAKDFDPAKMDEYQRECWENYLKLPDKDTQAVNFEIALAYHFRKTNRKLTSVAWDSSRTRVYTYGQPGMEDHLNSFLNGGTSLGHVLHKTLDLSEKDRREADDILVITDAEISDRPGNDKALMTRLAEFKKREGRVWVVVIGGSRVDPSDMPWADGVLPITSLTTSQKTLADVVRKMALNRAHTGSKQIS